MPTAEITPKSILRHRPINPDVAVEEAPLVSRAKRPLKQTEAVPTWKMAQVPLSLQMPRQRLLQKQQKLPLLGVGMLVTVLVIVVGQVLLGWIGNTFDDLRYGYPRTYQTDAVVGHDDSLSHPSHFLAMNIQGHIEIIELPSGDASHAHIFVGPQLFGPGADRIPVTLQFINPNHARYPDMQLLIQGSLLTFHNVQGTFRSP